MKLCINCRHRIGEDDVATWKCGRTEHESDFTPVNGTKDMESCVSERRFFRCDETGDRCGPDGKYWEAVIP